MASTTSIIVTAESQEGNTVSTTITNVNPAAGDDSLKAMAQQLNALTTNTYEKTTKVTKEDIL